MHCRCRRRFGPLPRKWAHQIGSPERGCLLVARQPNMGPLSSHAVILILEHGELSPIRGCLILHEGYSAARHA